MTLASKAAPPTVAPAPAASASPGTLEGYALVWGAFSDERYDWELGTTFRIVVDAAEVTMAGNCFAVWNHDLLGFPIGAAGNGSLRYGADDSGLWVEIDLPDTTCGRDVLALVRDGYAKGMSARVYPLEWTEEHPEGGGPYTVRFTKIFIDEVTVTHIPAMAETSIRVADEQTN